VSLVCLLDLPSSRFVSFLKEKKREKKAEENKRDDKAKRMEDKAIDFYIY